MRAEALHAGASAFSALLFITPDVLFLLTCSLITAKWLGQLYPLRYRVAICLVFGLFGSLTGVFMGASKQPLTQSLLPPFISIVVGYLAYVFQKDSQRQFIRFYLPAIVTMMLAIMFSTFFHRYFILRSSD